MSDSLDQLRLLAESMGMQDDPRLIYIEHPETGKVIFTRHMDTGELKQVPVPYFRRKPTAGAGQAPPTASTLPALLAQSDPQQAASMMELRQGLSGGARITEEEQVRALGLGKEAESALAKLRRHLAASTGQFTPQDIEYAHEYAQEGYDEVRKHKPLAREKRGEFAGRAR